MRNAMRKRYPMRSIAAALLLLASLMALPACGRSGATVNVRPPMPGQAPNLLEGIPTSIKAGQTLSDEFLDSAGDGTPTTASSSPG